MFGQISTRCRKDLNSEAAGREVTHDQRDRKDEFVQKQKRHKNCYTVEISSFYTISKILMMKVNLCDNQRPQLEKKVVKTPQIACAIIVGQVFAL